MNLGRVTTNCWNVSKCSGWNHRYEQHKCGICWRLLLDAEMCPVIILFGIVKNPKWLWKTSCLWKNWLGNRKKIRFLFLRSTKITRYQICWIPTFKRLKSCKRTSFWKSFCLQKNPQSCLGARKTKNTYGKERADVNLASKNGATPLYLAATWERTECLIHLLDARAKVTQLQTSGVFSGVIELPIAGANSVPQKRLHRLHWLLPHFWGDQAWC